MSATVHCLSRRHLHPRAPIKMTRPSCCNPIHPTVERLWGRHRTFWDPICIINLFFFLCPCLRPRHVLAAPSLHFRPSAPSPSPRLGVPSPPAALSPSCAHSRPSSRGIPFDGQPMLCRLRFFSPFDHRLVPLLFMYCIQFHVLVRVLVRLVPFPCPRRACVCVARVRARVIDLPRPHRAVALPCLRGRYHQN